jgi:hypothetical protein
LSHSTSEKQDFVLGASSNIGGDDSALLALMTDLTNQCAPSWPKDWARDLSWVYECSLGHLLEPAGKRVTWVRSLLLF